MSSDNNQYAVRQAFEFDTQTHAPHRKGAMMIRAFQLSLLTGVLLAGCSSSSGPETVSVSGIVTLNGKPLDNAEVYFMGNGLTGFGRTDASGKYQLVQGAVSGVNQVFISRKNGVTPETLVPGFGGEGLDEGQVQAAAAAMSSDPVMLRKLGKGLPKELVPTEYSDPEQTRLTYPVPGDGTSTADFHLLASH
ncbi:hypothetical protein GC176_08475 [bacterium]|nr:hypothetical protein [bacterium]